VRELRQRHNGLFSLGLMAALLTSAFGPVLHIGVTMSRPWTPGDIEMYDLQPEAGTLVTMNAGHWGAVIAGLLGALLVLAAATALPRYAGIPLALLAVALGAWNVIPIAADLFW
jgi:hypothetical protein